MTSVSPAHGTDWPQYYERLIGALPQHVKGARLSLCSMNACVDARISMHEIGPLLADSAPAEARAFADIITGRARRGVGGEVRVEWSGGPAWITAHIPVSYALGGTGPQAGWTLAAVGAPALVALEDRSAHMLALLHPGLLLAEEKGCVPASEARPRGARRPEIFIFEYTAGRAIGDFVPTRSSRIIVRFHDPGLEHDPQFDTLSLKFASTAGAGVISGFNAVPRHRLDAEIERVRALAGKWRGAGLAVVHLELAGYDTAEARDMVLEGMRGTITSIGMSHSEFLALQPGHAELAEAMCELGRRLRVTRVCVHADDWAASVIQGDPEKEREALAMGCLLAGTRAAKGVPSYPRHIDPRATFATPPAEKTNMQGGWSFVACPSPHLDHPVATVGLGDSFTGGCLLILGHQPARAETLAAADRTATSA